MKKREQRQQDHAEERGAARRCRRRTSTYSSAHISVQRGVPVRIEFVCGSDPTCRDKSFFPPLGVDRELPDDEVAVVEFTPTAGSFSRFAGMLSAPDIVRFLSRDFAASVVTSEAGS